MFNIDVKPTCGVSWQLAPSSQPRDGRVGEGRPPAGAGLARGHGPRPWRRGPCPARAREVSLP